MPFPNRPNVEEEGSKGIQSCLVFNSRTMRSFFTKRSSISTDPCACQSTSNGTRIMSQGRVIIT
jgi:hypothetical protein